MAKHTLSARDLQILVQITNAEAGNEDPAGKMAVLQVIKNRMEKRGQSVHQVVFADCQFEPTRNGSYYRHVPAEKAAQIRALALAVFNEEVPDITGGSDHFLNCKIQEDRGHMPQWVAKMWPSHFQLGRHTFLGGNPIQARIAQAALRAKDFFKGISDRAALVAQNDGGNDSPNSSGTEPRRQAQQYAAVAETEAVPQIVAGFFTVLATIVTAFLGGISKNAQPTAFVEAVPPPPAPPQRSAALGNGDHFELPPSPGPTPRGSAPARIYSV